MDWKESDNRRRWRGDKAMLLGCSKEYLDFWSRGDRPLPSSAMMQASIINIRFLSNSIKNSTTFTMIPDWQKILQKWQGMDWTRKKEINDSVAQFGRIPYPKVAIPVLVDREHIVNALVNAVQDTSFTKLVPLIDHDVCVLSLALVS